MSYYPDLRNCCDPRGPIGPPGPAGPAGATGLSGANTFIFEGVANNTTLGAGTGLNVSFFSDVRPPAGAFPSYNNVQTVGGLISIPAGLSIPQFTFNFPNNGPIPLVEGESAFVTNPLNIGPTSPGPLVFGTLAATVYTDSITITGLLDSYGDLVGLTVYASFTVAYN